MGYTSHDSLCVGYTLCLTKDGMQGFLTAVLQNHARLTQTPIDQLSFGFQVMHEQQAQQLSSAPETGAYISGLHLEGARYVP